VHLPRPHINRRVNARTLRSTATPLLIQPFARTNFAKRSFRCAAPSVWNSLTAPVIGSDSLSVFKSRLKTFLFRNPTTSTQNRLPPTPLNLRPYAALQICLPVLLLLLEEEKRQQIVSLNDRINIIKRVVSFCFISDGDF